jgi:glycosyltransferase involved in cell wall biosynthesis
VTARKPVVSVCMATHNGERFIGEQISSILPQLGDDDELVISDDGSGDRTVDIVRSFNDSRIRIYQRHPSPPSPIKNFECALARASGHYLFLADQDDIWASNKIATMVALLSNYAVVNCDCSLIDDSGGIIAQSFFSRRGSRAGLLRNLFVNSYMGCCMGFRRELLNLALPFPCGLPMHDMWIGLLAETRFRTLFLDRQLVMHRCHDQNASPTASKSANPPLTRLRLRTSIALLLIRRLLSRSMGS